MKTLLKNKKALSPVVAAIILIAVTVAVSIAVAAWMGSLTIGFMETAELTITDVEFATATGEVGNITLTLTNSGTSDATVTSAKVNGVTITTTDLALPQTYAAGATGQTLKLLTTFNAGNKYSISLFANDGTLLSSYTATADATYDP